MDLYVASPLKLNPENEQKSSHTQVLASMTTTATATALLALWPFYTHQLLQEAIHAQPSFFSSTASPFSFCCHDKHLKTFHHNSNKPPSEWRLWPWPTKIAYPQPPPGWMRHFWRWDVTTRGLDQAIPRYIHYMLGLPGLSSSLPCHLIQITTQCWSVHSSAPLFTQVWHIQLMIRWQEHKVNHWSYISRSYKYKIFSSEIW